jgi:hypothetical protein
MKSIKEIIREELQASQELFEVGEANLQPYLYTKDQDKDDINVNYYFDTEDRDHYIVHISESYEGVSVDFKALGYSNDDIGMGGYAAVLNKGRMYKIFATIAKIIKEYAQEYDPQTIEIEPLKSKGPEDQRRLNIYMAFIKKNIPNNYYLRFEDPKIVIRKKQALGSNLKEVQNNNKGLGNKKLYYHGRSKSRPYTGKYIFITDNLGYASGYSDENLLYTFTIPFSQDKIFSIKNPQHLELLRKYTDDQTVEAILRDSGPQQEIDWATLSYISTDDFEDAVDLFEHLKFYGVRLKERQGIDSIYIFNENTLDYQGTLDTSSEKYKQQIGKFYKDFQKDKNFLEEGFQQQGIPKELWHLTTAEKYIGIKERGLDPNFAQQGRGKKGIYLTDDKYTAENYSGFYKPDEKLVLLKINTNGLDYNKFSPDDYELQEFLDDGGWGSKDRRIKQYSRYSDVPAELSLLWVNQVKYLGIIPPENIEIYIDDKKFSENNTSESLADKYAEKQFNINDPNIEQDLQAKGAIQKDKEKPYGYANKIAIYKNPQSLENFGKNVRAIGCVSGNLYVAQKNGMLMHGQMGEYINLDHSNQIYSGKYLLLNRDGLTNNFVLSDTSEEDYPQYQEHFNNIIKNIETKNPRYKILASIDHVDDEVNENQNPDFLEGNTFESLADRYAEREFNFSNSNAEMDLKARGELQKDLQKPYTYVAGGKNDYPLYKNPKTLENFDQDVRAISDSRGNLYVAQKDGGFNHGEMANELFPQLEKWTNGITGVYLYPNEYILLRRTGNTNKFGLSDSGLDYSRENDWQRKQVDYLLQLAKRQNPQYDFYNDSF